MARPKNDDEVKELREQSEPDPFEALRGTGQDLRLSWQRTAPYQTRGHLSPANVAWSSDAIDDVIPFMAEHFGGGSYLMAVRAPNMNGAGFKFLRHIPIDIAGAPKMQGGSSSMPAANPMAGYHQAPYSQSGFQPQPAYYTHPAAPADPVKQLLGMLQPILGPLMERLLTPQQSGMAPPIADVASLVQTLAGTVQRTAAPADPFDMFERVMGMVQRANSMSRQLAPNPRAAAPAADDGIPPWASTLMATFLPLAEKWMQGRQSNPGRHVLPQPPPGKRWAVVDVDGVERTANPQEPRRRKVEIEEDLDQDSSSQDDDGDEYADEDADDAPIETADEAMKEVSEILAGLPPEELEKVKQKWQAMQQMM